MKIIKKNTDSISPLIALEKPKSSLSEKFKGIRTNIIFSNANEEIQSVVFSSEKSESGKSTISANVAITYAQAGYKTLLLDGDMRKPTQHSIFNKSNNIGLSNLIIKNDNIDDYINNIENVKNLDLLTSGPIPPNPSELISSNNFSLLFKTLKEEYDMIIIDTPPVNTVTDAQLFSELSKFVILVIDVEKNDKHAAKKGKELIEKTGAKVLGVVLNKITDVDESYYYYGED
ncbi:polysaccharide biosynthesis tyrosine autokinase [Staphylococcus saprophyticus]|uniref:polysaccharide biosynthesis tyrosine autokinase n=1 Tax=Staphylococcus saprophyticus TaxID=29385 RepID=UPI0011A6E183|nr:polysaccharide biosynthesis tyrosine autokinase [Staphylococcus saprophyticus]MBU8680708.1 polysaccharide biosynthesis tyrosine autokinase [Staphylococcus saprophyticus]MVA84998.1 polysaccharide biosynthesis tyrosine autokinase [Staphylococcus saprophyticus]